MAKKEKKVKGKKEKSFNGSITVVEKITDISVQFVAKFLEEYLEAEHCIGSEEN